MDYRRWISAAVLRQLLNASADPDHHLPTDKHLDVRDVRIGDADPSPDEGHYVVITFTDETPVDAAKSYLPPTGVALKRA